MSLGRRTKTEHVGAKNGGGYWGKRADAKRTSKKLRRQRDRREVRRIEYPFCHGHVIVHKET